MGLKILVVDDSALMRKMVLRALRQSDCGVDTTFEAENGQAALEAVAAHKPDAVLCDWNMPVMNGLEFIQALREPKPPVIMLTTEGTGDKREQAMAAGAVGYVTKPFTPEKLGAALAGALRKRAG